MLAPAACGCRSASVTRAPSATPPAARPVAAIPSRKAAPARSAPLAQAPRPARNALACRAVTSATLAPNATVSEAVSIKEVDGVTVLVSSGGPRPPGPD